MEAFYDYCKADKIFKNIFGLFISDNIFFYSELI